MNDIAKNPDGTIDISLTRGDYFAANIDMLVGEESYTPTGGSCRFALKRNYRDPDDKCLLNIDIPLNTLLLEIEGDDTKPFGFGCYVYDIQYTDASGHPDTFIKGKFNITEEVI